MFETTFDPNHSTLKRLPVAAIRESESALRSVQRETEEYEQLVDSVRRHGVLKPILVREDTDPDTGETFYWLVDGLQRWNACKDAGLDEIDAKIVTMNEAEVLTAQIVTNIHKIETTPSQYSEQLKRMMGLNPTLTIPSLAAMLSRSVSWVSDRLGLLKLKKEILALVDEGKINMTNAYALAKLPPEEQDAFVDRAMTLQPQEFTPAVNTRAKEIREAKRQGRLANPTEFVPVPHLQKLGAIKDEFANPQVGHVLVNHTGARTALDGFKLAIAWVLHQDPLSLEQAHAREAARKQQQADDRARRKAEREARKRAEILGTEPVAAG